MNRTYDGLKVAFLHPRLEGGGAERVSLTTAKRFTLWGIHSIFIAHKHNPNEFVVPSTVNASIHCLPDAESFYSEQNRQALAAYIKAEGIKIVFTCYIDGSFFEGVREQFPCKLVFWNHTNPFWEHDYHTELGAIQATYSLKKKLQWHLLGEKRRVNSPERLHEVYERYRKDINLFDKYIVLCPEYIPEIADALRLSPAQSSKMTEMINTIELREEQGGQKKRKELVYVGRLSLVQKRFDRLLSVWKRVQHKLPDWELKFYGSGPDEWVFHKLVKRYKLERVTLCGYSTDLSQIYATASVMCMTSTFEGWGMVLAEAQTYGAIPVAFDCCAGVRFIINPERNGGVLVRPFDEEAYAQALIALCTDEQKRHELQQGCLQKQRDYAPDINDERWHRLLGELLS